MTEPPAVRLRPVAEIRAQADAVVSRLSEELARLLPTAQVDHIGATALPDGWTKGDVDLSVRVPAADFAAAVTVLRRRFDVAQSANWTATFASFSDDSGELPVGLQVYVIGSETDFLLPLRDRMRADPALRQAYDRAKRQAAAAGAEAYWAAKNDLLRAVVAEISREPG